MNDSPLDRALEFLLADDPAAALRWSVAALERDPTAPRALLLTSCALGRLTRSSGARAAMDGLRQAARRAAVAGDVPIAIAAIGELRTLGGDVLGIADEVAAVLCRDAVAANERAGRLIDGPLPFAAQTHLRPISAAVGGRALVSRATQMIYDAESAETPAASPLRFFRFLSREGARDLVLAFDTVIIPAHHSLIEEGETVECGFVLAIGGAEIWRRGGNHDERRVLAQLESGALFGELALLVRLPSPASVTTTQGSIVLVAWRDAIEAVGAKHPEVRFELGAHCKRQAAANLGSALGVLDAVPLHERAALVERMELRTAARGERLASLSEEAEGLHVIVSGEVLLVARDGAEQVVLETLAPGDTVGETELVLCRTANTEAVAVTDAATLFLPRDEFFALSRDYPAILHGVYAVASRRHADTNGALGARAAPVGEECLVDDAPVTNPVGATTQVGLGPSMNAPVVPPPASAPEEIAEVAAADLGGAAFDDAPPPFGAIEPAPDPFPAPADSRLRSHGPPPLSARAAVGMTGPDGSPSVAPATLSQKPSAPAPASSRATLARASMRATAVVAVAAGVCAALVPRGDRRSAGVTPAAGANPPPETEPAFSDLPVEPLVAAAAARLAKGAALASAPPAPSSSAKHHAHANTPTAAARSDEAKSADGDEAPSALPRDAPLGAAAASASPSTASASASARPATRASAADDFGGRE